MLEPSENSLKELLDHMDDWFQDEEHLRLGRMSQDLYPYTHLFQPIQVNGVHLKNRIVMGPVGNVGMPDELGRPSNKMIQYYTERARGGVGLITSGLVFFSQTIDPTETEPGDRSLLPRLGTSRTTFPAWRTLAENIHAYGGHFFIQLSPGVGRVGTPETVFKKWKLPVSASWNPNYYLPAVPCRPLTDGECRRIIKLGGQAAADAKALLIDGINLHGHEGYLLDQMTNPAFNRRKLGRYANWQAFGLELVTEMRKRVGPDYPITYRIDLSLALNACYGEGMNTIGSLKKFRNERTIAMTLDYMLNLVKVGVDMFDVDLGTYDNWWLPHPPNGMPSGCYLPISKLVKDVFKEQHVTSNAGLPVPVVAVGKLGYPDLAEKALRDELCDMVMLARPLLADPHWPNKVYAGRVREIIPCISDQEACLNEFIHGGHIQCAVNPRTCFEDVIEAELQPAARLKKVAVVGAGPAGILCAVTAAQRGHQVTLFEKSERIGGMLVPGSVPRTKYEVGNYLTYLEGQVQDCQRQNGLTLRLRTEATLEKLQGGKFEAVVLCTGSRMDWPDLDGIHQSHVISAIELLRNPQVAESIGEVVIVGGGPVGCECAHFLASEYRVNVCVVEMLPHFMPAICTANRAYLLHTLEKLGARLLNCTRLKEVRPGQVTVLRNISKSVPNPFNTWNPVLPDNVINPLARPIRQQVVEEILPADLVVIATGLKPDIAFYETCVAGHAAPEIHLIGDAFQVGRVFEAVKAGFTVGRTL